MAPEKRWRMTGEKFGFPHILTDFQVAPEKIWRMTGEKFGFPHILTDFEVAPKKRRRVKSSVFFKAVNVL